jgi:hypothetical protein
MMIRCIERYGQKENKRSLVQIPAFHQIRVHLAMVDLLLQILFFWLFLLKSLYKLQKSAASHTKHQSSCYFKINGHRLKNLFFCWSLKRRTQNQTKSRSKRKFREIRGRSRRWNKKSWGITYFSGWLVVPFPVLVATQKKRNKKLEMERRRRKEEGEADLTNTCSEEAGIRSWRTRRRTRNG